MAFTTKGDLLGELEVHHGVPRTLTAVAVGTLEACVMSAELYGATLRQAYATTHDCSARGEQRLLAIVSVECLQARHIRL